MMYQLTLESFTSCGAHQTGHFLLSSGLHSGDYLQCALFLAYPQRAESAGCLLAESLRNAGLQPEMIVSPAMGGLIIGQETARGLDVPHIFSERAGGKMALRRGFAVRAGQRIVVVEDVVTTGGSSREVIELLEGAGAEVIAMASLVNRSGKDNPFAPLPFHTLLAASFPTWSAEECPLCKKGKDFDKPGSRPLG
jgi:orotate phosphoribosyltransferase